MVSYRRQKTKTMALLHFGEEVAALLRQLPASGPLFPYLRSVRAADRATEFKQRCRGLGISGVTLHSYRYAWAERAKQCGYPERFAQEALGHNSKAVHRAYARKAQVVLPPLEDYERKPVNGKVVKLRFAQAKRTESANFPAQAQPAEGVPTLASRSAAPSRRPHVQEHNRNAQSRQLLAPARRCGWQKLRLGTKSLILVDLSPS